jgi:hypothetical protein
VPKAMMASSISRSLLWLGVRLKDTPPGLGTPQEILAK